MDHDIHPAFREIKAPSSAARPASAETSDGKMSATSDLTIGQNTAFPSLTLGDSLLVTIDRILKWTSVGKITRNGTRRAIEVPAVLHGSEM